LRLVIGLVILTLLSVAIVPTAPVYAASLNDWLNGNDQKAAGQSVWDILLGLLLGNWIGRFFATDEATPPPANGINTSTSKELIGFYAEWWGNDTSSYRSYEQNAHIVDTIAPFWATVNADGSVSDRGGNDHKAVVDFAHKNNDTVLLLVNNAKEKGNEIHQVLANPQVRAKAIANLEAYIKKYNLDGINIDFEMVDPADRDNLTVFMRELANKLKPQGYIVTIDVMPKQNESLDVAMAYDYAALASIVDKVILMTYDNHGAWSGPGPVADIRWVENNLKYALKFIPSNKLYLGIAAYGYDWSVKGVESLEYKDVAERLNRYGSTVLWDEPAKSPHFVYTDANGIQHEVWFENSQSLKYKLDLIKKYDLAGAAMWKLGQEDPGYWQVFSQYLS